MNYLPEIFSLIVLASGWYYLFYSSAAHRLSAIEAGRMNLLRVRLRRLNGLVMMLLAVSFFAAVRTITRAPAAGLILVAIILLMTAMVVLALIDLHLTRKLRRQHDQQQLPGKE